MQKCEKKSDAEAWNKVFYESNVNTLVPNIITFIKDGQIILSCMYPKLTYLENLPLIDHHN